MFKIVKNNFTQSGIVRYENENGDKLNITSNKTGTELKIKFRSVKDIKFETIEIKYPYELTGLSFKPSFSEELYEYVHSEELLKILQEVIKIVEKWIIISEELVFLSLPASNINMSDKELEKETFNTLDKLAEYEEMQEFVAVYKVMLQRLNYSHKNKPKKGRK